jgi:hypothetical protein
MTRWIHSGEPLIDLLSLIAAGAVVTFAAGGALAGLARLIRRDDPPEEPGSDADGGGGNQPPSGPGPKCGGDPAWWPEFEREFASYVAATESERRPSANAPTATCAPRRRPADRRARRRPRRTASCAARRTR